MAKVSQDEFDKIKREAQQKELLDALKKIPEALKEQNDNSELVKVISDKIDLLKETISSIKISPNISIPEITPEIVNNIEVNNENLIEHLNQTVEQINKGMFNISQSIENRPKEWKFKVDRDKVGYINEVKATAQ